MLIRSQTRDRFPDQPPLFSAFPIRVPFEPPAVESFYIFLFPPSSSPCVFLGDSRSYSVRTIFPRHRFAYKILLARLKYLCSPGSRYKPANFCPPVL